MMKNVMILKEKISNLKKHLKLIEEENCSLSNYSNLAELVKDFCELLCDSAPLAWTKKEHLAIKHVITLDWQSQLLVKSISDDEISKLAILPYPEESIRLYFLLRCRRLRDSALRERLAMHFLLSDFSEVIRDNAAQLLAGTGWSQSESYAQLWWTSKKPLDKVTALNMLLACRSTMLPSYLSLAKKSRNETLKRVASAIEAIIETDKSIVDNAP